MPIDDAQLHAYVDGALAPDERAQFERELASDTALAQRVSAYQQQRGAVQAAFAGITDEPIPERLRLRAAASRPLALRVAAVIAWLAIGTALGWNLRGPLDQVKPARPFEAELVERARLAHTIYTAEPRRAVEVAASQEDDMIRWLSKRMNTAVRVPKLTDFGFDALGGRLLPGLSGPACQIMYQNAQGQRLTIYLARDPHGVSSAMRFSDADNVHVIFWSDGQLAFAISAALDPAALKRIAAAVAATPRL